MRKGFLVMRIIMPAMLPWTEPEIDFYSTFQKFSDAYKDMERRWEEEKEALSSRCDYISFSEGNTMRGVQHAANVAGGAIVVMFVIKEVG